MSMSTMRNALLALALGFSTTALGQSSLDAPPRFLARPDGARFIEFYPPAALTQDVVGEAVLDCTVRLDTTLNCALLREAPEDWGFGSAALAVAQSFRASPKVENGVQVDGGKMRIPLRFNVTMERDGPDPDWPEFTRQLVAANPPPDMPRWSRAPSASAVSRATPQTTTGRSVRGRVTLGCTINDDRRLDCAPARETPAGRGLAAAALMLSQQFEVYAEDVDFIARHKTRPFYLPVNFGASPLETPLSTFNDGMAPMNFPPPPRSVIEEIYPRNARSKKIAGSATILCTVNTAPPMSCDIERESPAGWGFGRAARTRVQQLPMAADGDALLEGDAVRFEFEFAIDA